MAVRVVAERGLSEERALVESMSDDDSARVRAAAKKALGRLDSKVGDS
jgi:hypothetical protein